MASDRVTNKLNWTGQYISIAIYLAFNGLFSSFANLTSIKYKQMRCIEARLVKRAILTSSLRIAQVWWQRFTGNDSNNRKLSKINLKHSYRQNSTSLVRSQKGLLKWALHKHSCTAQIHSVAIKSQLSFTLLKSGWLWIEMHIFQILLHDCVCVSLAWPFVHSIWIWILIQLYAIFSSRSQIDNYLFGHWFSNYRWSCIKAL